MNGKTVSAEGKEALVVSAEVGDGGEGVEGAGSLRTVVKLALHRSDNHNSMHALCHPSEGAGRR